MSVDSHFRLCSRATHIMSFHRVTFYCAFAALGSFLAGYDSSVIGSSIKQDAFLVRFGHLSTAAVGGIVSSYTGELLSPSDLA